MGKSAWALSPTFTSPHFALTPVVLLTHSSSFRKSQSSPSVCAREDRVLIINLILIFVLFASGDVERCLAMAS